MTKRVCVCGCGREFTSPHSKQIYATDECRTIAYIGFRLSTFTSSERKMVPILWRDPCAYCGDGGGVIDHIEPKYHGGERTWENLTAACARCNSSKSDRSLLYHLLRARGVSSVPGRRSSRAPVMERKGASRGAGRLVPEEVSPREPEPAVEVPTDDMINLEDAIEAAFELAELTKATTEHTRAVVRSMIVAAFDDDDEPDPPSDPLVPHGHDPVRQLVALLMSKRMSPEKWEEVSEVVVREREEMELV